jgi:hypothetical protein
VFGTLVDWSDTNLPKVHTARRTYDRAGLPRPG